MLKAKGHASMKTNNRWNDLYDVEHPPVVSFADGELKTVYNSASFGVSSNYSSLKRVLLYPPTEDLDIVKEDPVWWLWDGPPDLEQSRKEWNAFIDILRKNGVQVEILKEGYPKSPKHYWMRDQATMTPWGAIISRMALTQRWGEEQMVAKGLWALQIPVLLMVTGDGTFEGGNYVPLDRHTVVIGRGIRTNESGIRQVENLLKLMDIETIVVDIPGYLEQRGGFVHVDVCMNPIEKDLVLVYPESLPYWFLNELRDRGFDMIEVEREETLRLGTNVLPLEAKKVILTSGNPNVKNRLEDAGVKVIEIGMDELMRIGGGPRCLAMELLRV